MVLSCGRNLSGSTPARKQNSIKRLILRRDGSSFFDCEMADEILKISRIEIRLFFLCCLCGILKKSADPISIKRNIFDGHQLFFPKEFFETPEAYRYKDWSFFPPFTNLVFYFYWPQRCALRPMRSSSPKITR